MKNLLTTAVVLSSFLVQAQETTAPHPKVGMETFARNLKENVTLPYNYFEKEGFTMQISVDSLANATLTELSPYNSVTYKSLKTFVENTEWIAGKEEGNVTAQTIEIPIKLDKSVLKGAQKAYPKEGIKAFYKSFTQYIFTTYYRNFKYSQYQVKFEVDEKGKISINSITPADSSFQFEVKRFLERKTELWTPAMLHNEPVKSTFTLPIIFQN